MTQSLYKNVNIGDNICLKEWFYEAQEGIYLFIKLFDLIRTI